VRVVRREEEARRDRIAGVVAGNHSNFLISGWEGGEDEMKHTYSFEFEGSERFHIVSRKWIIP